MNGNQDSLQETITLITGDENTRGYFFAKAKDKKWFEPLKAHGFFDVSTIPQPVKTEKGFVLSFWPQQSYLERLADQIQSGIITDASFIESFLDSLRKIDSTSKNFFLGRSLFLILMKLPLTYLTKADIERGFSYLLDGDTTDTLIVTTAHEGLGLILPKITDNAHQRDLFKVFTKKFLTISSKDKHRNRDPKLVFFSDWAYKQFKDKYFNVEKLAINSPFILLDAIEVFEKSLTDILSSSDLDQSTQSWRPAIEEHYQNNYHNSAQAVVLGAIGMCVLALINRGYSISQMDSWRSSQFKTFNRLYIFCASYTSDSTRREEAAQKILDLNFSYECMHEIYHFLLKQFEYLSIEIQDNLLDFIEKIRSDFSDEEEMKQKQTAWMKLRWLEAISKSGNARVQKMRSEAMVITNNGVPEHPDFGSYMGRTFVGPTSPRDEKWFSEASSEEILNELITFRDTDEFASPSIDGLARTLESWTIADPMKASALVKEFDKLKPQYISSLLDGYSKNWSEKKYVPLDELFGSIKKLVTSSGFIEKVVDEKTRMCWAVNSICRFVEAGTRSDENAFDSRLNDDCYLILKKCLEACPVDRRDNKSSDFYSRAINEPRGRIFEALVILTLRRARLAKSDTNVFLDAWNNLRVLIDPILQKQDEHETSLHAHLGAFFRQFQFLSKDWLTTNIDIIVPSRTAKPTLWRAFMDGFSYVTNYSSDMYLQLRNKGHLLEYLRLDVDSDDKNSRLDRLQNRVIELSLVAYVLGDESLEDGIVGTVLKDKMAEEWHQMVWSIHSILGHDPEVEHLGKAKDLIFRMIDIYNTDATGESFVEHFKGLGRFLDRIKDPSDEIVGKIIKIVAEDKESPWELGDLIDYLHEFKESHPKVIGELFKLLLAESKTAPAWPPDKVKEISLSLLNHGEKDIVIDICRIYSERSPTCEPIRDICTGIVKKS